ncbi:MAG: family 16 glycoside hydrolase [Isosphaeraceae bacterium]
MHRITRGLFCALLVSLCGPGPLLARDGETPAGFQPLFNGRDLAGWRFSGGTAGDWFVDSGALATNGRPRGWLMTEREYDDFELRLEYQVSARANSGVLLRGTPADNPVRAGMEIQIVDDDSYPSLPAMHSTGAIYDVAPRSRRATKPAGEWNAMRIVAKGSQITVFLNDVQVVDADLNDYKDQHAQKPWLARARGYIGLQSWDGKVEFRDIAVKSLSDQAPRSISPPTPDTTSGFAPLFNGRDLTGWTVDGNDSSGWRVEGGEIVASGRGWSRSDFLLTDREYTNFVLRLEFKVTENANSGVGLRALLGERVDGRPRNLEVQIRDDETIPAGQTEPTGSLFWSNGGPLIRPTKSDSLKPRGEWNTMEVELVGQTVHVTVNRQRVLNSYLSLLIPRPQVLPGVYRDRGRIGLQRHTGEVRFRNIQIKERTRSPTLVLDVGGHTSTVRGAVFTPDGQRLITVSHEKTIRIWDVNTGTTSRVLRTPLGSGPIGEHFGVALSPDGNTLAVGGYNGCTFLIDLPSGRMLHFLVGHLNSVLGLDFSPDGSRLATASADRTVRVWGVASGQTIRTLTGHAGSVNAVRFSPDGKSVATGAGDKSARIFSADDGSLIATANAEANVADVDWSQDGRILVTGDSTGGGDDSKGFVSLWSLNGTLLKRYEAVGGIGSIRATRNGAILYNWNKNPNKGAVILDVKTGQPRTTFNKSWNWLYCCALSPDGRLAATAGFDAADVRIWRISDGEQVRQLRAQGSGKWSAGWSADGTTIAWGNGIYQDRPMRINDFGPRTHSFDMKALQVTEPTGDFQFDALTLDDLHIEHDAGVRLSIKRGGEVVKAFDTLPFGADWKAAAWIDRDRLIVGSFNGDLCLLDASTGKLQRRFIGHVGTIWAVAPSPDRRHFLTASLDSTLRIWSLDDSSPILSLYFSDQQEWIAWTGKGYYAASPGGEQLMGWQVSNGLNTMASYYPASQFRKTLYRPDVIKRLLQAGSLSKALAEADAAAGKSTQQNEVAQILPPKISITKPATSQVQLTGKTLDVEAVAESVGAKPVTEMRVLLDGRPVPDGIKTFSPVTGQARARWTIEVPSGSHIIVVQAGSAASKAVSDPVEVVAAADPDAPKGAGTLYVLAIGINDYPDKRLKLDCAVPDAQALRQAFLDHSRRLFRGVEAKLLLDAQATRANILGELRRLTATVKSGDVAVVFYAGHGDYKREGQLYLVPFDADIRDLKRTGISGEAIKQAIGDIPCTTMLVLDACYAGSFDVKKRKTRALPEQGDAALRELVYDAGLVVFCGADKDREASEENGQGFFTKALVEGLSGKADYDGDGVVELDDLKSYVTKRVRALSGGDQEPTLSIPSTVRSFALSKP